MSEYVLEFAGHKVLSQGHGKCQDCRRDVVRLLLETPKGREWRIVDQLVTGLVVHTCGRTVSARNEARAAA
ncbi:MAG TPA: hypothetical protein VFS52_20730 [Steroidobacteraceae bacterium]|nr:hypothetical protein [Steroidobacteraceae bacterium]